MILILDPIPPPLVRILLESCNLYRPSVCLLFGYPLSPGTVYVICVCPISNCLFEATYEKVLEICRCTPYFHWAGIQEYGDFCRGKGGLGWTSLDLL